MQNKEGLPSAGEVHERSDAELQQVGAKVLEVAREGGDRKAETQGEQPGLETVLGQLMEKYGSVKEWPDELLVAVYRSFPDKNGQPRYNDETIAELAKTTRETGVLMAPEQAEEQRQIELARSSGSEPEAARWAEMTNVGLGEGDLEPTGETDERLKVAGIDQTRAIAEEYGDTNLATALKNLRQRVLKSYQQKKQAAYEQFQNKVESINDVRKRVMANERVRKAASKALVAAGGLAVLAVLAVGAYGLDAYAKSKAETTSKDDGELLGGAGKLGELAEEMLAQAESETEDDAEEAYDWSIVEASRREGLGVVNVDLLSLGDELYRDYTEKAGSVVDEKGVEANFADYLNYADKSSKNAYGTSIEAQYGDVESTREVLLERMQNSPQQLASFVSCNPGLMGMAGINPETFEIKDAEKRAQAVLQEILSSGDRQKEIYAATFLMMTHPDTKISFGTVSGMRTTFYMKIKDGHTEDAVLMPEDILLKVDAVDRNEAKVVQIESKFSGDGGDDGNEQKSYYQEIFVICTQDNFARARVVYADGTTEDVFTTDEGTTSSPARSEEVQEEVTETTEETEEKPEQKEEKNAQNLVETSKIGTSQNVDTKSGLIGGAEKETETITQGKTEAVIQDAEGTPEQEAEQVENNAEEVTERQEESVENNDIKAEIEAVQKNAPAEAAPVQQADAQSGLVGEAEP